MMANLYLATSVVFPLFCMMSLGYGLKRTCLLNALFLKELNALCFNVFLPLVLFINIYKSDFYGLISKKLILFAVLSILLAFALLMLIIPLFVKDNSNRGVLIQSMFRSNYILFGVPIATSLYGADHIGTTAILLAFVIPLYNLLSVVALSVFAKQRQNLNDVLKKVLGNPLIVASLVAFFFVLSHLKLPILFENTLASIASVATPLALIVLGGSFSFKGLGKYKRLLSISVLGKLVLCPGIFIPLSICVGFRGVELAALMAMFASPTAVSTYTMAQHARANDELAGQAVVLNSILSILSIFLWINLLKHYHLI